MIYEIQEWIQTQIRFVKGYQLATIVVIGIVVYIYLKKRNFTKYQKLSISALVMYILLLVCITVVNRNTNSSFRTAWIPFWSFYQAFLCMDRHLFIEICLNIIMMIPFGALICGCARGSKSKCSCMAVILYASIFESLIELLQLLLKKGLCEFDDIVAGIIGAVMGYAIHSKMKGIFLRRRCVK